MLLLNLSDVLTKMIMNYSQNIIKKGILLLLAIAVVTFTITESSYAETKSKIQAIAEADSLEAAVLPVLPPAAPLSDTNRILREINELGSKIEERIVRAEDLLTDRIGAVDQRLSGVENRTNETFIGISSFEQQFWYIILALLFLSLVTVLSILILTFRFIEPMKKENKMLNESFIRLQTEIPKNSENIHQALKDLAKDDPYIAQILKKNKLL